MRAAEEGGARVGVVTSATVAPDGRPFALGYLRCRSRGAQVCHVDRPDQAHGGPTFSQEN